MVVKVMRWRSSSSKKFAANVTVHKLRGLGLWASSPSRFSVEIKWKGPKGNALTSMRRSVRRNFTREETSSSDGGHEPGHEGEIVQWNEEFQCVCNLSACKEGLFHPWEVSFTVFSDSKQGSTNKVPIIGAASLNIADFATTDENRNSEVSVPLSMCGDNISRSSSLHLSILLFELKDDGEMTEPMPRSIFSFPRSPCYGEVMSPEKEEQSNLNMGWKKVKIFGRFSAQRGKLTVHEEVGDESSSVKSDDFGFISSLETESFDDSDEGEQDEARKSSFVRKSFNYGSLAFANHAGASIYPTSSGSEDENWIYYSHHKPNEGQIYSGDMNMKAKSFSSKRRLLSWRKRTLSLKSHKRKEEPLLKNYYGEEGGDDIDFDRRQLSSSDESTFEMLKSSEISVTNHPSNSEFGDDNFAVGVWEKKEIVSRDGQKKLQTEVFFASIDQRCEEAAGESACTALVAVIAHWLQSNRNEMPIKSQLDCLIREGSSEWRNLCDNEIYRERFPDKHFDLETVLEAKLRPLSVVPEKSYVGFFHPQGLDSKDFDFLQGAMSFDNIWDEICRCGSGNQACSGGSSPLIYIISWNDHFFVLKVDHDAYYIIDTLGERLHEGCNQAFVLKFNKDAAIHRVKSDGKPESDEPEPEPEPEPADSSQESTIVCMGKESCKEYIKSFLAAIPISELEVDLKKGLIASTLLHHRLQIEFHHTGCFPTTFDT